MVILKYPVEEKNKKILKEKNLSFPQGSKNFFIDKVRTGEFVTISYVPKNAKSITLSSGRKIKLAKFKTFKLPKSNSFYSPRDIKLVKGKRIVSVGR